MSAPFRPKTVLLGQGVRRDLGKLAVDNQDSLRVAQNVVFTRGSALRGRPAPVSADTEVQGLLGTALLADIATARAALVSGDPTGVLAIKAPTADGGESPMLTYDGLSMIKVGDVWTVAGLPPSLRQTRSAGARTEVLDPVGSDRLGGVSVGPRLLGSVATRPGGAALPFLNSRGTVDVMSTAALVPDSLEGRKTVAADDAGAFWVESGGGLWATVHPTIPTAVTANFASGASTGHQAVAAVRIPGGNYIVAVVSATAGRITLYEVSATLATTVQSLNVNGLGTVAGVALSRDTATGRIAVYWVDTATTSLKSKIFTVTPSFTDQALNVTHTATAEVTNFKFVAGHGEGDLSVVLAVNDQRDLEIRQRSYTTTAETLAKTYYGVGTGFGIQAGWDPLFGCINVGGRFYVGAVRWELQDPTSATGLNYVGQWVVLDMTTISGQDPRPVAVGPARQLPFQGVGNAAVSTSGGLVFGLYEGTEFSFKGVTKAVARRIELLPQGTAVAHGHGLALTTSARANSYDGVVHKPHGHLEEFPFILYDTTASANPGSLAAGDYTVQATWEMINAAGQVVRSGQSNVVTYTVAASKSLDITVTIPQLVDDDGTAGLVTVRLWSTEVNPTSGAPLYLVGEVDAATGYALSQGHVVITYDTIDPEDPQLYTVGNVVDDMAPPAGDRGVAFAGGRLWVASQDAVYPSKVLRPNVAPAWNTQSQWVLPTPAAIGQVQALLGLDADLLVIGDSGIARVYGPGYDDLGSGAGWAMEVTARVGVGETSPRCVVDTPQGPLVSTSEGEVWLVQSFIPTLVSKPTRDLAVGRGPHDLAFLQPRQVTDNVYGTGTTNATAVIGSQPGLLYFRVLDVDVGAWATWTVPVVNEGNEGAPILVDVPPLYVAGVNGILWTQSDDYVFAYTGDPGDDDAEVVIETSILRPLDGAPRGWGRVQGVSVHATDPAVAYDLRVEVLGDSTQRVLMDKEMLVEDPTITGNWPESSAPQYRCTHQNASFVIVRLTASHGIVEWSAIDLWVSAGSEPAPTITRS